MRNHHHTISIIAVSAALAVAGCGGGSSSSSSKQPAKQAAAPMSTTSYVALVRGANDKIDAARRAYFHSKGGRAVQARRLQAIKAAYDSAISRLAQVRPPVAGRSIHSQILSGMRSLSSKLGAVLSHNPLNGKRASDLLYHDSDQLGLVVNQVYTIP
jgi:hypothetical protein